MKSSRILSILGQVILRLGVRSLRVYIARGNVAMCVTFFTRVTPYSLL